MCDSRAWYLSEMGVLLAQHKVALTDAVIVGAAALDAAGISIGRLVGECEIVASGAARESLRAVPRTHPQFTFARANVQLAQSLPWLPLWFNVTDDELVTDTRMHVPIGLSGLKAIRPELMYLVMCTSGLLPRRHTDTAAVHSRDLVALHSWAAQRKKACPSTLQQPGILGRWEPYIINTSIG
jgi:hypothetical protein